MIVLTCQVVGAVGFQRKVLAKPEHEETFLVELCMRCMAQEPQQRPYFPVCAAAAAAAAQACHHGCHAGLSDIFISCFADSKRMQLSQGCHVVFMCIPDMQNALAAGA